MAQQTAKYCKSEIFGQIILHKNPMLLRFFHKFRRKSLTSVHSKTCFDYTQSILWTELLYLLSNIIILDDNYIMILSAKDHLTSHTESSSG